MGALAEIRQRDRWPLIFDASSPEDVNPILPGGGRHVPITSGARPRPGEATSSAESRPPPVAATERPFGYGSDGISFDRNFAPERRVRVRVATGGSTTHRNRYRPDGPTLRASTVPVSRLGRSQPHARHTAIRHISSRLDRTVA
jgi:hypothetical protein